MYITDYDSQVEHLKKENERLRKEIDFLRFRLQRIRDYTAWTLDVPFDPNRWQPGRFDPSDYRRKDR